VTLDAALAGQVSEAERELRALNDSGGAALAPLARLLLRTESIASSRVEGMQIGARELARAEAKLEAGVTPGATAREVIANIDAMTLAMDEAAGAQPFDTADICAIHRRLFERTMQRKIAGRFRTEQNWVGGNAYNPCGAEFVPPPPEHLEPLLADLCAAITDDTLPPLVQAALVHAQFETIHPFDDGNGRTGRALVHVILRRRGVAPRFVPPISVVFANARSRYIAGLDAFRFNRMVEWLTLFVSATTVAARLARRYLDTVQALQVRWREQLRRADRAPRADAAAWAIIDLLPAHPVLSGPGAVAATGRSKMRVYEAIAQLAAAGVLLPVSSGKRNQLWESAGLIALIERMESGDVAAPAT
jgi:Fic family protein